MNGESVFAAEFINLFADAVADRVAERVQVKDDTPAGYLKPENAAKYLDLTLKSLQNMAARGTIPRHYIGDSKTPRYKIRELDELLAGRSAS